MTNLVVNKLSEFLSKIIINYSTDQLTVSLLKGEVHLRDFEVDVNVVNIYVEYYIPFLHVTKVSVSDVKLSLPDVFHISSKPSVVEIGHIDIECTQRDFTAKSAAETLGDDFPLASTQAYDEKELNTHALTHTNTISLMTVNMD